MENGGTKWGVEGDAVGFCEINESRVDVDLNDDGADPDLMLAFRISCALNNLDIQLSWTVASRVFSSSTRTRCEARQRRKIGTQRKEDSHWPVSEGLGPSSSHVIPENV